MSKHDSITIWVLTEIPELYQGHAIEEWTNYMSTLTEEDAWEEIHEVLDRFNSTRNPADRERKAISFVLEEVTDE